MRAAGDDRGIIVSFLMGFSGSRGQVSPGAICTSILALTGGEVSDFKGYLPIMDADGPAPKVLLADKGYDADFIREDMERRGGTAMIPTKRNRLIQLPVDAATYALRNMVERCFNKLKNARRLATRYDKTADSYLGFIHIVSIRLWMRQFVNAS